ncbi:su(var)2-HP2 [Cochliomyia hominivorax]
MEDIEYLEEYKDLVLPALNSAAAAASTSASTKTNKVLQNQKANDDGGDDSSSSLDQDIFNCLFDDNSDDDDEDLNEYQRSDQKIIEKIEVLSEEPTTKFNTTTKITNKITSSTPKPKTFATKTTSSSGTTVNTTTRPQQQQQQTTFATKPKSIATVRPTVQNQQRQQQNSQKKSTLNILQRSTQSQNSLTSSYNQRQKPTTSTATTTSRGGIQLPVLARKPLSTSKAAVATSSTSSPSASTSLLNKKSTSTATTGTTKIIKRPATIIRPEKIETKDPANDPLNLDDISEAGSDNYSVSDISGQTYNSISEFDEDSDDIYYSGDDDYYDDDDEYDNDGNGITSSSHVIDISNDSSGARSKLFEDLRAPTPAPVISEDSETTSSSSSGFLVTPKRKTKKPYNHPNIIESVLRKGEKPKLLELLQTYDLLDNSDNNIEEEEDNIVIDITASRDNLVESFDTDQLIKTDHKTLVSKPVIAKATATATAKDSPKTNKKNTKKKNKKNMDNRNLRSPGAASTDSDLSAVEELLEESYAEAMKRNKDTPYVVANQEVGAELEIGGEEEVAAIEIVDKSNKKKQKLPKSSGVVIDYDEIPLEENVEFKNQKDKIQQEEQQELSTVKEKEIKEKEDIEGIINENQIENISEIVNTQIHDIKESTTVVKDSPTTRKKKRFRNLLTPEPNDERPIVEPKKSIDDVDDFKGFEEIGENVETITEILKTPEKIEENIKSDTSFKSPSHSHKSLRDKTKDATDTTQRDSSKVKSTDYTKSKSSKDSSKDKSSRESSTDKSSRENSKERSRESSKDRSQHSHKHDKHDSSKKHQQHHKDHYHHHHSKDHRKSSDSKEFSKSRESSKSRDSKEFSKHIKSDTKDISKTTIDRKEQNIENIKEKSTDKKIQKAESIKENPPEIKDTKPVQIIETKQTKDLNKEQDHHKKTTQEHKSSLEKKDKKESNTPAKDHKQHETKNIHKSSESSFKTSSSSSSRDCSKERKSINKSGDINKSFSETNKTQISKKSTPVTTEVSETSLKAGNSKTSQNTKDLNKTKKDNKNDQNITKTHVDSHKYNKDDSSCDLNKSKSCSKNIEGDKKLPSKSIKDSNKKLNKSINEKKDSFTPQDSNKTNKDSVSSSTSATDITKLNISQTKSVAKSSNSANISKSKDHITSIPLSGLESDSSKSIETSASASGLATEASVANKTNSGTNQTKETESNKTVIKLDTQKTKDLNRIQTKTNDNEKSKIKETIQPKDNNKKPQNLESPRSGNHKEKSKLEENKTIKNEINAEIKDKDKILTENKEKVVETKTDTVAEKKEQNNVETKREYVAVTKQSKVAKTKQESVKEKKDQKVTEARQETVTEKLEQTDAETKEQNVAETKQQNAAEIKQQNIVETKDQNVTQTKEQKPNEKTTEDKEEMDNKSAKVSTNDVFTQDTEHAESDNTDINITNKSNEKSSVTPKKSLTTPKSLKKIEKITNKSLKNTTVQGKDRIKLQQSSTNENTIEIDAATKQQKTSVQNVTETKQQNVAETNVQNVTETKEQKTNETTSKDKEEIDHKSAKVSINDDFTQNTGHAESEEKSLTTPKSLKKITNKPLKDKTVHGKDRIKLPQSSTKENEIECFKNQEGTQSKACGNIRTDETKIEDATCKEKHTKTDKTNLGNIEEDSNVIDKKEKFEDSTIEKAKKTSTQPVKKSSNDEIKSNESLQKQQLDKPETMQSLESKTRDPKSNNVEIENKEKSKEMEEPNSSNEKDNNEVIKENSVDDNKTEYLGEHNKDDEYIEPRKTRSFASGNNKKLDLTSKEITNTNTAVNDDLTKHFAKGSEQTTNPKEEREPTDSQDIKDMNFDTKAKETTLTKKMEKKDVKPTNLEIKSIQNEEFINTNKKRENLKTEKISNNQGNLNETKIYNAPEIVQNVTEDSKMSQEYVKPTHEEEEHIERVKTRRRGNAKTEVIKETERNEETSIQENINKESNEQEHITPIKTRRRANANALTKNEKETTHIESSNDETIETQFEPMKTRKRGDIKSDEEGKDRTKILQKEDDQRTETDNVETKDDTNTRRDHKEQSMKETSEITENKELEQHTTKNRKEEQADQKTETDKAENKDDANASDKQNKAEHITPKRRGDHKENSIKGTLEIIENKEPDHHITENRRTRKRGEQKVEIEKVLSIQLSETKSETADNDSGERNLTPIKTRKVFEPKTETIDKEATEIDMSNVEHKEQYCTTIKTRKRLELTDETENHKMESAEKYHIEEQHISPIKIRKRIENKTETVTETEISEIELRNTKIKSQHDLDNQMKDSNIVTRKIKKRGDNRTGDAEQGETSEIESSNEQQIETRKTPSRAENKQETEKETTELKNHDGEESTATIKVVEEQQYIETIKHRTRRSEIFKQNDQQEIEKEKNVLKTPDAAEFEEQHVKPIKLRTRRIECSKQNETIPTADIKSMLDNWESKDEQKFLEINELSEATKLDNLEADMSGSESSLTSTNSDNTLRRTLRKRGTESPFPENDNNKKIFKEPSSLKTTALQVTPKSVTKEKPASSNKNVLSTNISLKRNLRSPAILERETQSSSKKIKLDTTKKSIRFRNLHDDCQEEVDLKFVNKINTKQTKESETADKINTLNENKTSETIEKSFKSTVIVEKQVEEKIVETSRSVVGKLDKKGETNTLDTKKKVIVKKNSPTESNQDKSDNSDLNKAPNTPTSTTKTDKTKLNTVSKKSPGSTAVLSFSDWLKTKNQTTEKTAIKANTSDIVVEHSENPIKDKENLNKKSPETEIPVIKEHEKTHTLDEKLQQKEEHKMASSNKGREPPDSDVQVNQNNNKTLHESKSSEHGLETSIKLPTGNKTQTNLNATLDNSLLQPAEMQLENALKEETSKCYTTTTTTTSSSGKKGNVKRLKTSAKKSANVKSKTTVAAISPPKPKYKKSEIEVLIESMSKEMKESGITDLLNTQTHVKRQRIPVKRNEQLNKTAPPATTISPLATNVPTTETTLAASALSTTICNTNALISNKTMPKVLDFSENLEILNTTSTLKSPTKRKAQQNPTKSKKSTSNIIKEASKSDISLGNLQTSIKNSAAEISKVSTQKSKKSLNIKELPTHQQAIENICSPSPTTVQKSRKSMPLLTKHTAPATTSNTKSKKSIVTTVKDFKSPSNSDSHNLNLLEKLYVEDDDKRSDSRLNNLQTTSNLKFLKCRNFQIRLNRSIVKKYLNSIKTSCSSHLPPLSFNTTSSIQSNQVANAQTLTGEKVDVSPIILNNTETSLRIQSVVDAATLLNSPVAATLLGTQETYNEPEVITDSLPIPVTSGIQESFILPSTTNTDNMLPSLTSTSTPLISVADANETIELKNEFMDENPINDAILPDTPTLLARAQSVTQAAQHALSNSTITPTDIRLLSTDSSVNSFVPSFGVTPRALDNKGTSMYTFLHPAKYNRNHSNVLLDYCCPNLDGPMPAIDPTRIHAQVQVPVIELPASIVLTTKVVTRADLESGNSSIPAIIRKKAEKIRKNMATHHKNAVVATAAQSGPILNTITQQPAMMTPSVRPALSPTINALTKQLPSTTTITAKIRAPIPTSVATASPQIRIMQPPLVAVPQVHQTPPTNLNNILSVVPKGSTQLSNLSNMDIYALRSSLRRFDVLLKQLVQPFESLSFAERHHIIETLVATDKFSAKDLDKTLELMEEYVKQTSLMQKTAINNTPAPTSTTILSTTNYITNHQPPAAITSSTSTYSTSSSNLTTMQMPQLHPSPSILASHVIPFSSNSSSNTTNTYAKQFEKTIRKTTQSRRKNSPKTNTPAGAGAGTSTNASVIVKQRQVPIYDTERNIIGYQMQVMTPMSTTMPAFTKSTMSKNASAIMSTSTLDTKNRNKMTTYSINKRPFKRPAQDSPRVFYTTPPLQTSIPKTLTNTQICPTQHTKNANNTIAQKTQVTTIRSAGPLASGNSETITTTTMATVKRVTRSTATGSKIIIVSKSNQSSDETILPDANSQHQPIDPPATEIKNEKEDFLG